MTHYAISASDPLSKLIKSEGIKSWDKLMDYVQKLPYGRNKNREDLRLVMVERKGTCSSKHAFLKQVADLNQIPEVKLILGMYQMNAANTPQIGETLEGSGLDYVPEAHCYLNMNGTNKDLTFPNSDFSKLENNLIQEIEIEPRQVNQFKVDYHQEFLRAWIKEKNIALSFEEVWDLRETCIRQIEMSKGTL
jgi:hypothetical protein